MPSARDGQDVFRGNVIAPGGRGRLLGLLGAHLPGTVHRAQHQLRLVGLQHQLQPDHSSGQKPPVHRAFLRGRGLLALDHAAIASAQPLQLGPGGHKRHGQQALFVFGVRHPREGPDFGVGQACGTQRFVDAGQRAQGARHPYPLSGGARVPPHPPAQPVGARAGALLVPGAAFIEAADALQQPVGGGIEVRREGGDLLGQVIVFFHGIYYTSV